MMPKIKLASLALLAGAPSVHTALGNLDVTFLHINDHHSHFDSNSFDLFADSVPDGISVDTSSGVRVYFGGASYVAGTIKELADLVISQGHEVMKIHAGDAMTGTVYYSLFGAEPDAAFMNEVGFDAFVIGNHE
jgi:5'-nucleotidase